MRMYCANHRGTELLPGLAQGYVIGPVALDGMPGSRVLLKAGLLKSMVKFTLPSSSLMYAMSGTPTGLQVQGRGEG